MVESPTHFGNRVASLHDRFITPNVRLSDLEIEDSVFGLELLPVGHRLEGCSGIAIFFAVVVGRLRASTCAR